MMVQLSGEVVPYVHYPGVDISELLEAKETSSMGGVVEDERLRRQLAIVIPSKKMEIACGGHTVEA